MANVVRFNPASKIVPSPCPSADSRPFVRTCVVPQCGKLEGIALHDQVLGYPTHFLDRRTVPCLHSATFCQGCRAFLRTRWEGYLGMLLLPNRSIWIVKISAGAYRNCPDLILGDGNLRGRLLVLTRMGEERNSPVKVAVSGKPVSGMNLPVPFKLEDSLARLWGYESLGEAGFRLSKPPEEGDAGEELPT